MSLVRFENVSKRFAADDVLVDVSFRVEPREHIGLIGRNGTGKSTIFRLVTGETKPDAGYVDRMRKARFAFLAQLPEMAPNVTIFDAVMHAFSDLLDLERELGVLEERMAQGDDSALEIYSDKQHAFDLRGGYTFRTRIDQVLHGLGFTKEDYGLPFKVLSGGQRTRLMLALTLLEDADLLLLDEPENHLDLEAREWLESYLAKTQAGVLVISHDRRTLNAVGQRILELERGSIREYTGNYDDYCAARELVREQQQRAFERQQELIRKEQVFIDRFRYKATKAKQVQSRIKRLEKMEKVDAPDAEKATAGFKLGEVVRTGQTVLTAERLNMRYGDLQLYAGLSFQVFRGERLGIIGPNGAGKSTLLRQLAGRLPEATGEVALGNKVKMGYYDQHHEDLNPANDILTEVHAVRPDQTPERVRTFLGQLLFSGDDVFKEIKVLSGGERARVSLAKLLLADYNLLLLDEPTNHLDLVSREALEAALAEWPGTIITVTHDRVLLDRLVDKLVVVERGEATVQQGNYADLLARRQAQQAREEEASTEEVLRIRREQSKPKKDKKRSGKPAGQREYLRKVEAVEADIERLEAEVAAFDEAFTTLDPQDFTRAQQLKADYDAVKELLQQRYSDWERLAEVGAGD